MRPNALANDEGCEAGFQSIMLIGKPKVGRLLEIWTDDLRLSRGSGLCGGMRLWTVFVG